MAGFEVASCPACSGSDLPCVGYGPQEVCFTLPVLTRVTLPGHRFSGNMTISRGFKVTSYTVGGISYGADVTWMLDDTSGAEFADALEVSLGAVLPAGAAVTVTPPATAADACVNNSHVFAVSIGCVEDTLVPLSVAIVAAAGGNLLLNPGFAVATGWEWEEFPMRQDGGGHLLCTNTPNRGWETNDPQQKFEWWIDDVLIINEITQPPLGTRVVEINATGADTLWQTFQVTTAGTYTIEVTVGGRDQDEDVVVALSAGDTGATLPGTIFNQVVTALRVTQFQNPWTVWTRQEQLAVGTYTLAIRGPVGGDAASEGGLLTDVRVLNNTPGTSWNLRRNTCTVTKDVEVPTTTCQIWQPVGSARTCVVDTWTRLSDGLEMTNAAFWAQDPAPSCCPVTSTPDESTTTAVTPAVIESHAVTATFAAPWTPTQVPSGVLVGLTATVMSGTLQITDVDGTVATATAGTVVSWKAPQETGQLIPPTLLFPAAAGNQSLVVMEVRT